MIAAFHLSGIALAALAVICGAASLGSALFAYVGLDCLYDGWRRNRAAIEGTAALWLALQIFALWCAFALGALL